MEKADFARHGHMDGRMLIVGFGSIASSLLPLLLRHIDIPPERITVLCPATSDVSIAEEYGVNVVRQTLTEGMPGAESSTSP